MIFKKDEQGREWDGLSPLLFIVEVYEYVDLDDLWDPPKYTWIDWVHVFRKVPGGVVRQAIKACLPADGTLLREEMVCPVCGDTPLSRHDNLLCRDCSAEWGAVRPPRPRSRTALERSGVADAKARQWGILGQRF